MKMLLSRPGWLFTVTLLAGCYDTGSPSVDNPRPARACFYNTSVNTRYFVFQERAQGCAVLSLNPLPDGGDTGRHSNSTGTFWSRGFANEPTLSVTQVPCEDLIQLNLLGDGAPELEGTSGKRGWAHVWTDPDPTALDMLGATSMSASIDFEPDAGASTETIRILELELTDRETVHECVLE